MDSSTIKRKARLELELKKIRVQDEKDRRAAEFVISKKKIGMCYKEKFGNSAFILRKIISVQGKEPNKFTMNSVYIRIMEGGISVQIKRYSGYLYSYDKIVPEKLYQEYYKKALKCIKVFKER